MTDWAWSYSASQILHDCPRAFQFGQPGRSRIGTTSPPTDSLRGLAGSAVHHAISLVVEAHSKALKVNPAEAIREGLAYVDRAIRKGVTERANGVAIRPGEIERIKGRVRGDLTIFHDSLWPKLARLSHVAHEKEDIIRIQSHAVRVRLDYVCKSASGDMSPVEWKTTRHLNLREGGYQLAVYSLWAHERLAVPIERIKPILADLYAGELTWFKASAADLNYVLGWIQEDRDLVESYERLPAFPASPDPHKCVGCRFARSCPEGSQAISEEWPS